MTLLEDSLLLSITLYYSLLLFNYNTFFRALLKTCYTTIFIVFHLFAPSSDSTQGKNRQQNNLKE